MSYGVADELTLSVMTLPKATLVERIQAAAVAGFQGIGWRLDDFEQAVKAGYDEPSIVHLLESSKIRPVEIEFFREWIGREQDNHYRERELRLFTLAGRLRATRVNVGVFEPTSDIDLARSFASLCDRAASHNLTVQLEFMPFTPPVDTLDKAWGVVRHAARPNSGLLIDAWHWARTAGSHAALSNIPPERVTGIQLGDVLRVPMADVTDEARHYRLIPGVGALNLPEFLSALSDHGVRAPLSVEVMSAELDDLPPLSAARKVALGTRSALWHALLVSEGWDKKGSPHSNHHRPRLPEHRPLTGS